MFADFCQHFASVLTGLVAEPYSDVDCWRVVIADAAVVDRSLWEGVCARKYMYVFGRGGQMASARSRPQCALIDRRRFVVSGP